MKEIGMNHYRFSIEWSKIERQGFFDESVIQHYRNICDSLVYWDEIVIPPSLHKSNMV